jgi:hypothetical protein
MSLENNKLLFKALWQFMAKRNSSVKRELIPLHHLHTPPSVGPEIMLHDFGVIRQVPMLCGLLSHMQPALEFPEHKLRNFLF